MRPPLLTIALLSATALGYEILLMRLFSIIQWHHFAYMIISLALLGYGASGTFLAFVQARLLNHYPLALLINLALFGLTAMPSFLVAQQIPFNPEEILWNWREAVRLMFVYLLLSLPFFFAANAIALTFSKFNKLITRVYAFDLFGAGVGSLGVILILYVIPPLGALSLVSALGMACIAVAAWELQLSKRLWIGAAVLLSMAIAVWPEPPSGLVLSPYKDLSQTLRVSGARVIAERFSPMATLQVVENDRVPLRYAPGMSLNAGSSPPAQLGLFSDGGSMGSITRDSGDPQAVDFLDQLTSALPYHLQHAHRVLVLGAGGGMDVLQALYQDSAEIHAVELNPQVIELVSEDYADFSGGLYSKPGVQLHTAEGRGFVSARDTHYDLIQIALQHSSGASSAGLYSLSESYLYTTEALQTYLGHLSSGGYLAISRWIKLPPRDTLKLFVTAIEALRVAGVEEPGKRLILIRGWQTSTLLVKNGEFTADEIRAMRDFSQQRAFDVAWYHGMSADEPNRFNIFREPYLYQAAQALLGPHRQSFMEQYKFNLQPATDDQPYFHNFFKWSTLKEILELRGQGGMPLLEAGYPVLVATLAQALLASSLLILLPLVFLKRREQSSDSSGISQLRVVSYFFAIGLAFLFIEIAFIQKFMLFLHHPLFTASVVLASFLVFAGLGSNWSKRYSMQNSYGQGVKWAVAGILLTSTAYLLLLDTLFAWMVAWPTIARAAVSIVLIGPLAFFMGMPFPLALTSLRTAAGTLIPLAWAVNGCASVLSAVLATLLAIHFGFTLVVLLALLLYILAALEFPVRSVNSV
ncbi:MAG: spermidine synthase [Thiogranum sp.]